MNGTHPDPSRILVYRLGSLGDTLLALPCFHHLRARFPKAHITLLTHVPDSAKAPPLVSILAGAGLHDAVISYPLRLRSAAGLLVLRREISNGRFDLLVHLAEPRGLGKSVRDLLFFRSCGIRRIVGIPWTRDQLHGAADQEDHVWEAKRLADRMSEVGPVDLETERGWDLRLTGREMSDARALLKELPGSIIAVAPGAKVDAKDWTEANWTRLLDEVGRNWPGLSLVMLGATEDWARAQRCSSSWPGYRLNLCGKSSVRVSAAILRRSCLFIGHDSGPMHLAATVGTPCVAVFSARSHSGQWNPRGSCHEILYRRVECRGCGLEVCGVHRKKCLMMISPEDVIRAISRQLSRVGTYQQPLTTPCVESQEA